MRTHVADWQFSPSASAARKPTVLLAALVALFLSGGSSRAESSETAIVIRPASEPFDPFEPVTAERDPFESELADAPVDASAYPPVQPRWEPQPADYQTPFADDAADAEQDAAPQAKAAVEVAKDPCAAANFRPIHELGIGITQPAGQLPTDLAGPCWAHINQTAGSLAAVRSWPVLCYEWDATCFCHRPLYFEEINLERYGYGCCEALQPAASAAHFFLTVPVLPYCMAVECPGDCVYTLGHYRPGSCPPLRYHWPPYDTLAALAEGGVWTGLIFAIP